MMSVSGGTNALGAWGSPTQDPHLGFTPTGVFGSPNLSSNSTSSDMAFNDAMTQWLEAAEKGPTGQPEGNKVTLTTKRAVAERESIQAYEAAKPQWIEAGQCSNTLNDVLQSSLSGFELPDCNGSQNDQETGLENLFGGTLANQQNDQHLTNRNLQISRPAAPPARTDLPVPVNMPSSQQAMSVSAPSSSSAASSSSQGYGLSGSLQQPFAAYNPVLPGGMHVPPPQYPHQTAHQFLPGGVYPPPTQYQPMQPNLLLPGGGHPLPTQYPTQTPYGGAGINPGQYTSNQQPGPYQEQ